MTTKRVKVLRPDWVHSQDNKIILSKEIEKGSWTETKK